MKFLSALKPVILTITIIGFASCGQNAHVTAPEIESDDPAQEAQTHGKAEPATPTTNPDQKVPDDGSTVVTGPQGPAGKDGAAGEHGKDGCGIKTMTASFSARKLKDTEIAKVHLPYRSTTTNGHEIKTLQIGQMTGVAAGGTPFVLNSQVVFAIDVNLPPRAAIKAIHKLTLETSLVKFSGDKYLTTELLCFLDKRICSGTGFEASSWKANYNPDFWGETKTTANDTFSKQILENKVDTVKGRNGRVFNLWASDALQIELSELLHGSRFTDPVDFIYGRAKHEAKLNRTFPMVIADDVHVKSARLLVELEEDTCVSAKLEESRAPEQGQKPKEKHRQKQRKPKSEGK